MVYACSDLHGNYTDFISLLDKIKFSKEDEMYILGDVIDRGPDPIKLLMEIFLNSNMHLLAGNHEMMLYHTGKTGNGLNHWLENGGMTTISQLSSISKTARNYLLERIGDLPIVIPSLVVNGRKFYLAHSSPLPRYTEEPISLSSATEIEKEVVLWSRTFETEGNLKDKLQNAWDDRYRDRRLLIGHTPTYFCSYGKANHEERPLISRAYGGRLINLDCGCAAGYAPSCICLDDLTEHYL